MTMETSKEILETIEWFLSSILSVSSCMGMFLIGCFVCNLLFEEVSTGGMVAIFLGSMALTWITTQLHLNVRYWRMEILVDELERQKDEDEQKLYEHLTQGL